MDVAKTLCASWVTSARYWFPTSANFTVYEAEFLQFKFRLIDILFSTSMSSLESSSEISKFIPNRFHSIFKMWPSAVSLYVLCFSLYLARSKFYVSTHNETIYIIHLFNSTRI
jgi:hypothetical protein